MAIAIVAFRLRARSGIPISRCLAANVAALTAFVPLFAPAMPQIALTLQKSITMTGTMDANWFKNVWGQILGAMNWQPSTFDTPFDSLTGVASTAPAVIWPMLLVGVPAILLVGVYRALRHRSAAALLLAAPIAGAFLAFFHFKFNGTLLLKWYVFYTLPFGIALIAIALAGGRERVAPEVAAPRRGVRGALPDSVRTAAERPRPATRCREPGTPTP